MKRIFIILSNLLTAIFILWVCTILSGTLVFHYYPSVAVINSERTVQYADLKDNLEKLATDTDSLVARMIQETDKKGEIVYSYEVFGQKPLPADLQEASPQAKENAGLITNYYIFEGTLTPDQLQKALTDLGFSNCIIYKPSILTTLVAFIGNGAQFLAFCLFLLTFTALSVITKTREMRSAGLRLIAGEKRSTLFLRSVIKDVKSLAIGGILALVAASLFIFLGKFSTLSYYFLSMTVLCYNFVLFGLSVGISLLFTLSLRSIHLMSLIKGKMPLRRVMILMLLGQFIAVFLVTLGLARAVIYMDVWQEHSQGQAMWQQQTNLVTIGTSREYNASATKDYKDMFKKWYPLLNEAVEQKDALLSMHNLAHFMTGNVVSLDGIKITDYDPRGNTLFVTPNYLRKQAVKLDEDYLQKLEHLQEGEFGLILPEKLKNNHTKYEEIYTKYMNESISEAPKAKAMTALVGYTNNNQQRFAYNQTPLNYQQFLLDPILVVVTPKSTGSAHNILWSNALSNYLMFKGAKETQELIDKYQLTQYVAAIEYSQQNYQRLSTNIQVEIMTSIAGTILGIITSILLFNTMSLLYFEAFRREIFIKRIAGFRFFELHRLYIFCQFAVVFLASLLSLLFVRNQIGVSLIACLFFTLNAVLILSYRMKKEQTLSMIILKGA